MLPFLFTSVLRFHSYFFAYFIYNYGNSSRTLKMKWEKSPRIAASHINSNSSEGDIKVVINFMWRGALTPTMKVFKSKEEENRDCESSPVLRITSSAFSWRRQCVAAPMLKSFQNKLPHSSLHINYANFFFHNH